MAIRGFSEPKRIPRVGKIYLGVKTENNNGKSYPSAVDYFVVRADGVNTSDAAANAFHSVYGAEPREISIAFPSDDPELFMPQYLASYRGGGGRSELWCKGDGEWARRADGQGGYTKIPCLYQDCPIFQEKKCKPLTRLMFILPEVEGIGVWELDTTSYFSAQNLASSIQLIRQLTRGRIAMIPLTLRLVPQTVSPEGKMKTVYVLDLKLENIKLMDLLNRIPRLELTEPVVEPIVTDEMPDDLYVDNNLVNDQDIQRANSQSSTVQPSAPTQTPPSNSSGNRGQGGRSNNNGSTRQRSPQNKPEATTAPASEESVDSANDDELKASYVGAQVTSYGGQPLAKVRLRIVKNGEEITAVTDNQEWIERIKVMSKGEIVLFDITASNRWQNYLELTQFNTAS